MILAKLTDSSRYESLHPLFKQLFDYVKSNDLMEKDLGRIELQGDDLFINNSEPILLSKEKQVLEVHQHYIDIHIPFNGKEIVGWKALKDLHEPMQPFDVEKDFAVYDEPASTYFEVNPGEFLIVYPEDAHAPIIGEGKLRKLIAKVKVSGKF